MQIRIRRCAMNTFVLLAMALPVASVLGEPSPEANPRLPELRLQLLHMQQRDQDVRRNASDDDLAAVDAEHLQRLRAIVHQYGWPTISMVGRDGAFAAWLLVQHADQDPEFQRHVLQSMTRLMKTGEVAPQAVAYLHDRLHRPQRYGTQGSCGPAGVWEPREVEELGALDERRRSVGLGPFEEYRREASDSLCPKLKSGPKPTQ